MMNTDTEIKTLLEPVDSVLTQSRGFEGSVGYDYWSLLLVDSITQKDNIVTVNWVNGNKPAQSFRLPIPAAMLTNVMISGLTAPVMNKINLLGMRTVTGTIINPMNVTDDIHINLVVRDALNIERNRIQVINDSFVITGTTFTFMINIIQNDIAFIPEGMQTIAFEYLLTQRDANNVAENLISYILLGTPPPPDARMFSLVSITPNPFTDTFNSNNFSDFLGGTQKYTCIATVDNTFDIDRIRVYLSRGESTVEVTTDDADFMEITANARISFAFTITVDQTDMLPVGGDEDGILNFAYSDGTTSEYRFPLLPMPIRFRSFDAIHVNSFDFLNNLDGGLYENINELQGTHEIRLSTNNLLNLDENNLFATITLIKTGVPDVPDIPVVLAATQLTEINFDRENNFINFSLNITNDQVTSLGTRGGDISISMLFSQRQITQASQIPIVLRKFIEDLISSVTLRADISIHTDLPPNLTPLLPSRISQLNDLLDDDRGYVFHFSNRISEVGEIELYVVGANENIALASESRLDQLRIKSIRGGSRSELNFDRDFQQRTITIIRRIDVSNIHALGDLPNQQINIYYRIDQQAPLSVVFPFILLESTELIKN